MKIIFELFGVLFLLVGLAATLLGIFLLGNVISGLLSILIGIVAIGFAQLFGLAASSATK